MNEWHQADVAADYAVGLLEWLQQRDIQADDLLQNTDVGSVQLEKGLRLTTLQDATLLANAAWLLGEPGFGFELGLHTRLTWHGLLGLGLMSCRTLGDALELWVEYLSLRTNGFHLSVHEHSDVVELHIEDLMEGAPMRQSALERLITMTACLGTQLTHEELPEVEMWFKDEAPAYFATYQARLAQTRYGMETCQVRMPRHYLELLLPTANARVLRWVKEQCEAERMYQGQNECLVTRIKKLMPLENGKYPSMGEVAQALCMSSSTLKRELRSRGLSFRQFVKEARMNEVLRDVLNTPMNINEIAVRRGYSDAANLTRAFREWTGMSPSQYRVARWLGERPFVSTQRLTRW